MGRQPVPWGSLKGMGSALTKMGEVCGDSYVGACWWLPVPAPQGGKELGTNTTGGGALPPWGTPWQGSCRSIRTPHNAASTVEMSMFGYVSNIVNFPHVGQKVRTEAIPSFTDV